MAKRLLAWDRARPLFCALAAAGLIAAAAPAAFAVSEESREYYEDALEWMQKGDFRAAVIQLRNALQKDETNHSARLLLGRLYLQSGNIPSAQKELEFVHRHQPSDEVEVYLGRTLLMTRLFEDALSVVQPTSDDPSFAAAKTTIRAEALLSLRRIDEAEAAVEQLLAEDSGSVPANLLMARIKASKGLGSEADQHIDAALVSDPKQVNAYMLRAQLALQAGKIDRVFDAIAKIEEIAPEDARAQLIKAEALVRANELAQAESILTEFLVKHPTAASAMYSLARVKMLQGKYEDADVEISKLPESVRRQPATSLVTGLVKFQLKQYPQAEEALQRFVSVAGDRGRQARRMLATIQIRTDRPNAAIETLESLTAGSSGDVAAHQLRASAALRAGNFDTAIASWQRLAQIGSPGDRRQAQTFLRIVQAGKRNEAGQLQLEDVVFEVLKALDLAQFGETDAALERAIALRAEYPDRDAVSGVLARLYMAKNESAKAREVLAPALAKSPNNLAMITAMNQIDVAEGNFDAIEQRLKGAIEANPKNEPLILQLIAFYVNRGDREGGLALMAAKADELPQSLALRNNLINVALSANEPEEAKKRAAEAAEIGRTSNPNGLIVAGDAFTALKDYPAAVGAYSEFLEKNQGNPGTLLKLAQAHFLGGDTSSAESVLQTLITAQPANFNANASLIRLLLAREDYDGAHATANAVTKHNTTVGALLSAAVYRGTGEIDKAVTILQDQMAVAPSIGLVRQTYQVMIVADRRGEAEQLLTSWLAQNPDDPIGLQMLSAHYIQEKSLNKASALLERTFSLTPNNVVVLNNLAWVRYELDQRGAVELARRAYQMAPNSAAIGDTLGWILVRDGAFGEGLKLLYAAADLAPENGDIAYHLAFALNETGKPAEAAELLKRTLEKEIAEQNFTERDKAQALLSKLQ